MRGPRRDRSARRERPTPRAGGLAAAALLSVAALVALAALPPGAAGQDTLHLEGLRRPVEIVKDTWGVSHIYAETEEDLFFAQGFNAARDRLFQLEVWRRRATGTVAEILGPRELERDIGTRLFTFRGDMEEELAHYHPRGRAIVEAFVRGVNAWVAETERNPDLLSLEFRLLGIRPGRWTPEVVVSRHQGLVANVGGELAYGRAVARVGPEVVRELEDFGPGRPELALDPALDPEGLFQDILALYRASQRSLRFRPEDVVPEHRGGDGTLGLLNRPAGEREALRGGLAAGEAEAVGSNNWVVSGRLTRSGRPIMANDPHRVLAAPSLRYSVHLVGPGWNVIGGGEPTIPGVSIGHNEHGAWGLTVFRTDSEDLYVYETHPEDPGRYRYGDGWERMRVIVDTIPVKGRPPEVVELRYTRHGPVVFEDPDHGVRRDHPAPRPPACGGRCPGAPPGRAYAVRAAWLEPGGAPYLASLRMDQARTWEEFREACAYSNLPGENMVWADTSGTIGWQVVGIAPIRRGWSGLVPVPGDGRYEWDGFLPMLERPHAVDPREGFIATANNELVPEGYPHMDAVGFEWSDPYRWARIVEVLASGRRHDMAGMMRLQTDGLSIPARALVPLLEHVRAGDARVEEARRRLLAWNHVMDAGSVAAGIYAAWERAIRDAVSRRFVPDEARRHLGSPSLSTVVAWILAPDGRFGDDPVRSRDALLLGALEEAVARLTEKLGRDVEGWRWGQEAYHHARLRHPLSDAVDGATRRLLEVGPAPRGGYGYTVNMTGSGDNQTSGASFRIVTEVGAWDRAMGMNSPGQGGDPEDPHYRDLFDLWAADRFHPLPYSREAVESVAGERVLLLPGG